MKRLSRTPLSGTSWFAVEYEPEGDAVVLLDQRRLPTEVVHHSYRSVDGVADAIRTMVVRGAPAIGIAAAYAMVLVARQERGDATGFLAAMGAAGRGLGRTRPTAVNLGWAIARMSRVAAHVAREPAEQRSAALLREAEAIHLEDVEACRAMGQLGAQDVPDKATILTHCNAGALATGGYGTALGVVRAAAAAGKDIRVMASETRPYLQGARLTAWELKQDGVEVEVITDSMAGHFFARGHIDFVVVGSDRVAANGDIANKIGTYSMAVLAHVHDVPFTVAAPWSTVDLRTPNGAAIPIEQRGRDEVARIGDTIVVPEGVPCAHPAFDVTPARLVHAIYTERGTMRPADGLTPEVFVKGGAANAGATRNAPRR